MKNTILYIVVPCYCESEVLPITSKLFLDELNTLIGKEKISEKSRILFVNDGSSDDTWSIICGLSKENEHFKGISLSRNRGHQNALLAGMMEAKTVADVVITIDCDGQDDIEAMEKMIDEYDSGADIVYGARSSRKTDSFAKRFTAQTYYKLLASMGVEVVYNHADYRLVSAKVLEAFSEYKEVNLFLRGMFPLVGFKSTTVLYERHERMAGKTHYPLKKMIGLAMDGITSLSVKPIRLITGMGIGVALISFLAVIWFFIGAMTGKTVQGWASTTCIIAFLGGIQLIAIGVLGEYIGKIYMEVKERPRYIISSRTDEDATGEK